MPKITQTPDGLRIESACKYCGCLDAVPGEAKGPHGYGIVCAGCGRHGGWLSKALSSVVDDGRLDFDLIRQRRDQHENCARVAAETGDRFMFEANMKRARELEQVLKENAQ